MLEPPPRVLVVDDENFYIDILEALLEPTCQVLVARDGETALARAAQDPQPDLILLDIIMPDIDGYDVCRRLKASERTCSIPVIFLTVKNEISDEIKGFDLGAADYITKPMSPPIVLARVHTHATLGVARKLLSDQNRVLETQVAQRTEEIEKIQQACIHCLTNLAETRDFDASHHIYRIQHYVKILALQLRDHPRFRRYLNDTMISLLYKCSPLYDIGKMVVPDRILLKPGKLDEDEWEKMKLHAFHGWSAIEHTEARFGDMGFLEVAKEMAYTHHEKWDGSGYPRGLTGEDIPVAGRLMAVADVYDALTRKRTYREALPHDQAVEIIHAGRGTVFDPDIVDAFESVCTKFKMIARKNPDGGIIA